MRIELFEHVLCILILGVLVIQESGFGNILMINMVAAPTPRSSVTHILFPRSSYASNTRTRHPAVILLVRLRKSVRKAQLDLLNISPPLCP